MVFPYRYFFEIYPLRKSTFISAMAEGAKWVGTDGGGAEEGAGGGPVFCRCVQSVISLMKCSIVRATPPRMAGSGSAGQDVRCFRLVRLDTIYPFH